MPRLYKPADFSALLEEYADFPLFQRSAWNIDRERGNSNPSHHEAGYRECARKSGAGGNFYGVQRGRSSGFLLPVAFGTKGRTQLGAPILRSDLKRLREGQTSTEKRNVGEQEASCHRG